MAAAVTADIFHWLVEWLVGCCSRVICSCPPCTHPPLPLPTHLHRLQLDTHTRARCWFGAAVAMHMQGESETAVDVFKKAADGSQTGVLLACYVACLDEEPPSSQ